MEHQWNPRPKADRVEWLERRVEFEDYASNRDFLDRLNDFCETARFHNLRSFHVQGEDVTQTLAKQLVIIGNKDLHRKCQAHFSRRWLYESHAQSVLRFRLECTR